MASVSKLVDTHLWKFIHASQSDVAKGAIEILNLGMQYLMKGGGKLWIVQRYMIPLCR